MSRLVFSVLVPGLFTTVQDGGRWGYQGKGMPVAGAMDQQSFRIGNILAGNGETYAALEVTLLGPTLSVAEGEGVVAVAGAELGFRVNGMPVPNWTGVAVRAGDVLSFSPPLSGCRAYLCVSGGLDVPVVMGSRSTYTRARVGGMEGRTLKKGDLLPCGEPDLLWRFCEGLVCPGPLRPERDPRSFLRVVPGPQEDLFTEKGREAFYSSGYTVSASADRMGYRLEGPSIEHGGPADIISDAIPPGAVQVPGHGRPIIMLADRQTTGGYPKIGVVCSPDVSALAQRIPGQEVRFRAISVREAVEAVLEEEWKRGEMRRLRAAWRSTRGVPVREPAVHRGPASLKGEAILRVDGKEHRVSWEEIQPLP